MSGACGGGVRWGNQSFRSGQCVFEQAGTVGVRSGFNSVWDRNQSCGVPAVRPGCGSKSRLQSTWSGNWNWGESGCVTVVGCVCLRNGAGESFSQGITGAVQSNRGIGNSGGPAWSTPAARSVSPLGVGSEHNRAATGKAPVQRSTYRWGGVGASSGVTNCSMRGLVVVSVAIRSVIRNGESAGELGTPARSAVCPMQPVTLARVVPVR